MADQRKNAGNIGDVVKHSLLPPLVTAYGDSFAGDWTYCETHAGYYDYPLSMLKEGGAWKGERAWSVGVLEQSGQLHTLGEYGRELSDSLKEGVYPGSIRLIASLSGPARPTRIVGWDIGEPQVKSFSGRDEAVTVALQDGYSSVVTLKDEEEARVLRSILDRRRRKPQGSGTHREGIRCRRLVSAFEKHRCIPGMAGP